jgi:hypothetical protein
MSPLRIHWPLKPCSIAQHWGALNAAMPEISAIDQPPMLEGKAAQVAKEGRSFH